MAPQASGPVLPCVHTATTLMTSAFNLQPSLTHSRQPWRAVDANGLHS